jgi:hypothetical protein
MDVTNSVDVTDCKLVNAAVREIVDDLYPDSDFAVMDTLFTDFCRLYEGSFPGFRGCDIDYHNAQHVLDVTLAMARLMSGYETNVATADKLGPDRVLAGIAVALFHDSGYIRRTRDTRHKNGAAYTHIHVSRSARFMSEYLPQVGLQRLEPLCTTIVHFTSYLLNPADIKVDSAQDRRLGELLGTADLIAQMADVAYIEKLKQHLYVEFEAGGMAGEDAYRSHTGAIYRSPEHLMSLTPGFIRNSIKTRLDGYFSGAYRYAALYFGGEDLYLQAINENCERLEAQLAESA